MKRSNKSRIEQILFGEEALSILKIPRPIGIALTTGKQTRMQNCLGKFMKEFIKKQVNSGMK